VLDPVFLEYVTAFVDSSQAPVAAAMPPPAEEEEEEPGTRVCLQRNLPAAEAAEAAVEGVYAGVQMLNGLECKLSNIQQKMKKVRSEKSHGGLLCPAGVAEH
jgi:hypothetical protein